MRLAAHAGSLPAAIAALAVCASCGPARVRATARAGDAIRVQLVNNVVLIPVRIDGSDPVPFVLDTGASASVVGLTLARRLGLPLDGVSDVSTSGGSIGAATVKSAHMSLPGFDLGELPLLAVPLEGLEAGMGRTVGGILGAELFERFVVEIDYDALTVRLHERGYVHGGTAAPLPITFEDHTPFLRATLTGDEGRDLEGIFLIDTGAGGALTLNSPFVKRHDLAGTGRRLVPISSGALLAGAARAYVARFTELRIGDARLAGPIANLSLDTEGDEASETSAGFIGGEVLRRFTLITDYGRARVFLEPTPRLSEPFEFDMSGMSLAASGPDLGVLRVRLVIPGSAAAEAGIRPDDTLVAIDGVPAARLGLDAIRRTFRREGAEHRLKVKRADAEIEVTLTTRRLV